MGAKIIYQAKAEVKAKENAEAKAKAKNVLIVVPIISFCSRRFYL